MWVWVRACVARLSSRPLPCGARAPRPLQTDPIVITLTDSRHRRSPQFHNPAWRYAPVVHFVRHPLAAIGSLARKCGRKPEHADVDADEPMTEEQWTNLSWAFVAENFPALPGAERPLARALHYWRVWNLAAEELASWRVRVEDYCDVPLLEHLALGGDAVLAKARRSTRPGRCKDTSRRRRRRRGPRCARDARLAAEVRGRPRGTARSRRRVRRVRCAGRRARRRGLRDTGPARAPLAHAAGGGAARVHFARF